MFPNAILCLYCHNINSITVIGASLSEPHLVRSMAGSAMFIYIYICNRAFSRHIFAVAAATILHAIVCISLCVAKMAAVRYVAHFPCGLSDCYAERNESSSPTLPIIIDISGESASTNA